MPLDFCANFGQSSFRNVVFPRGFGTTADKFYDPRWIVSNGAGLDVVQVPGGGATAFGGPLVGVGFRLGTDWWRRRQRIAEEHAASACHGMSLAAEKPPWQCHQLSRQIGVLFHKSLVLKVHFFDGRSGALVGVRKVLEGLKIILWREKFLALYTEVFEMRSVLWATRAYNRKRFSSSSGGRKFQ